MGIGLVLSVYHVPKTGKLMLPPDSTGNPIVKKQILLQRTLDKKVPVAHLKCRMNTIFHTMSMIQALHLLIYAILRHGTVVPTSRAIQCTDLDLSIGREGKDTVDISTSSPSVVILIWIP